MRITIFGSGYVGLVTGACLADGGHDVICVDMLKVAETIGHHMTGYRVIVDKSTVPVGTATNRPA